MHNDGNTNLIFTGSAAQTSATPVTGRPAPRPRQPWGRLLKAVLDLAGEQAELVRHVEREWASATFSGSQHAITLRFAGADAAQAGEIFIVTLLDHEFAIPRYLVADAQIVDVNTSLLPQHKLEVSIEMLLLDQA